MAGVPAQFRGGQGELLCALCLKPIGQHGEAPAIKVEVRHKDTAESFPGRIAYAHRSCARQMVLTRRGAPA